ncbi:MAG: O-acetyl-ADP-ribose deacetylase [Firmicutes bacterium]|nr:O-acetyl-ADP-ribose deacetylase [Bacillota bacterium]
MNGYFNERIKIIKGDITKVKVDAIVNAANNTLLGGGGVDGAIHKAGGKDILKECKSLGGCPTGEAKITTAGKLPSKYVIHTVGPIYKGGNNKERDLLKRAYENSLKLAVKNNLKTIAFPSISTGVYSYPINKASEIAIETTVNFLENNHSIKKVIFVLFSNRDYRIYKGKLDEKFND